MKQTCYRRLTRFLRDFGPENDSSTIAILSLSALINALRSLDCPGKDVQSTVNDLVSLIRSTRPASLPLHHLLDFFQRDMARALNSKMDMAAARDMVVSKIEDRICQAKRSADALAEQGTGYVAESDRILVLGAGDPLIRSLVLARVRHNLNFKVSVAQVNPGQPRRLASELIRAGLEVDQVQPENPEDYLNTVDKLFMGPMPVTGNRKILAPKGTAELISCCRKRGVVVHLFADTLHYGAAADAPVRPCSQASPNAQACTWDVIGLDCIDRIVTEIGEVDPRGALLSATSATGDAGGKTSPEDGLPRGICRRELIPA